MLHKAKSQKAKGKSTSQKLKFLLLTCTCTFFLLTFPLGCFAEDKIVAIVNNEIITQKDLNDFLNFNRMQLFKEFNEQEVERRIQSMEKDLLEKLIEDRLILQEAKKNNVKIDEFKIKARIAETKKHYPSDAEFQNDLAKQGLVQADLEKRIREQLLMYTIVEQSVQSKVMVRPEEVTDFYNNNTKEFISPEKRDLEIIILDSDKEDLAKEFLTNFKSGQKLEDLAKKYFFTKDTLKSKRRGELRQDIEDVVFKMGVGEISEPVKVNDKYYVFILNNIMPSKQLTLSEAQDKIHAYLFENKMQEQLAKWIDELRAKAYIKVMKD